MLSSLAQVFKITERIEYKLLSLAYKVLKTTQAPYLHHLISVQPSRSTRSSSLATSSSLRITDRSFRYASSCLWSQLHILLTVRLIPITPPTHLLLHAPVISRVPCTKVLSQSTSGFVFLHHSTDLDEPGKPVTSVFLTWQHRKSYKPYKNGTICASAYLLCAQRFYRSAVFDRTFVQTLISLCVADLSGTKVLSANFIANPVLHPSQRFYLQR